MRTIRIILTFLLIATFIVNVSAAPSPPPAGGPGPCFPSPCMPIDQGIWLMIIIGAIAGWLFLRKTNFSQTKSETK